MSVFDLLTWRGPPGDLASHPSTMPPNNTTAHTAFMYLKNRVLHELRRARASYRFRGTVEFALALPLRDVRRILRRNDLGFDADGQPSWWYASLDLHRNDEDELTKAALRYVLKHVEKDVRLLVTGCGTGWMLFWFEQHGYTRVEGFDYLPNVVKAAKEIAALGRIPAIIWQDDGFAPILNGQYGAILVLHWLFSAWAGNYGNRPRTDQDREELLGAFLARYTQHLAPNGYLLLELIDAISDNLQPASPIYPIRHSASQVARVAQAHGLSIETQMFNSKYGYLPRMLYVLRSAAEKR